MDVQCFIQELYFIVEHNLNYKSRTLDIRLFLVSDVQDEFYLYNSSLIIVPNRSGLEDNHHDNIVVHHDDIVINVHHNDTMVYLENRNKIKILSLWQQQQEL